MNDLQPLGSHKAEELYNLKPAEIDNLMASSASPRRYLCLTKDGKVSATDDSLGDYVGVFSYSDTKTVKALYEFGDMNYIVGFIAIIAAAGVYLNFAFGLIQRAVNMAVLYIMSPITISFYPFDDGSRFNSQFVQPFYKEAISAFAVIISLNLFIVLISPVSDAVKYVTGSTVLGWLGLVAFISMLPKIRDQITGILGAGSMASKSLTSAFKDAGNALGNPINKAKNLGKKLAHAGAGARNIVDRMKVFGQEARENEKNKLQKLKDEGKLGWWGERRLNKLNKKNNKFEEREKKMAERQAKID